MNRLDRSGDLSPSYDPKEVEKPIYSWWEESGFFRAEIDQDKEPFSIIMPPPNVTGDLHLGHALTDTLEDILARWHRMREFAVLWLPGADHAGIATQWVVEQALRSEGKDRRAMGREAFVQRTWDWVRQYGGSINEQHRRLGASCDWSRYSFTLDEGPAKAVRETFVNLYERGLIYRGERMTNWCPRCSTVLSDLETEFSDHQGYLYHIRYPYTDGSGFLVVATTRPETLVGDTAVAVNPEDERYATVIGQKVLLPVVNREIPIIGDSYVDKEFGTGALKITPAHDPNDFEVGTRHGLEVINVFNPNGTLNEHGGPYEGQDRFVAREQIVEQLKKNGLLEKQEPYLHSVGECYRCQTVIEPSLSEQWFIKIQPLADPAIEAVKSGSIHIVPERFTRVYLNWLENIRDWCISRQLWWGHRIPVWYCSDCSQMTVSIEDPSKCSKCDSDSLVQDEDVLDTWFSSGLWPHSTLGWPEDSAELEYFYPTTVMETGYDILFFWVARMIMMGIENTGEIPFQYVFLHGLIRDADKQKMSKTKGNVINPVDAIDEYGADALRMALTISTTPGNDISIGPSRFEAGRNFANKLWNASRFVFRSIDDVSDLNLLGSDPTPEHREDRWIWSRFHRLTARVNQLLTDFQLGQAEQEVRDFIWDEFCDWYIELAKVRIRTENNGDQPSPLPHLVHILESSLRILHPFMPFVTEEIWQHLVAKIPGLARGRAGLIVASYPEADESLFDGSAEEEMGDVLSTVRAIRNARAEIRLEPNRSIEVFLRGTGTDSALLEEASAIEILSRAEPLHILSVDDQGPDPQKSLTTVLDRVTVMVPLSGLVDIDLERQRLNDEIAETSKRIGSLEARLANENFRSKAPSNVVEQEEARLQEAHAKITRLNEQIGRLS
ncbi:MAG: valine--tRNA ligase [SAR202 cluster bacterium]|nr:valine--tRNA ligase [SAR202 cluster bacterium]|tara:strand:- start:7140 stop:9824 length:2685 start_codon:yes stop_codon:yes gene_type:complete